MEEDRETDPVQPTTQPTSITFADLGIPTSANLQDTVLGKARPLSDITWKERVYAALMLVSIVGAAVMTIIRLTDVSTSDPDFTFCLVLLLNAVFCVWFVIEGVLRERPSELFILTFATVIIMVYLIVNYATGHQTEVKLARLVIACIFCPVLVVLGLIIAWEYHSSKRLIFRTVGANEMLQTLYRNLLIFQDFLKFDLQLGGSMIILILTVPKEISCRDIIILSAGGVVTVVWFILGFFTMPKEWKVGAGIFFLFSPVELGYVCYKIYDAVNFKDSSTSTHDSEGLVDSTVACGVGAVIVRLVVIVAGVIVVRNFGNGLKEKLKTPRSAS
ncbi:hypothetical protein BsWGS_23216 [Bradybaena similaris]